MNICDFCGDVRLDNQLAECYVCQYDVCHKDRFDVEDVVICRQCNARYYTDLNEIEQFN